MAHEQNCSSVLPFQPAEYKAFGGGGCIFIESGGGVVKQQHHRIELNGPDERKHLSLATREFVYVFAEERLVTSYALEQFEDSGAIVSTVAIQLERERRLQIRLDGALEERWPLV